jgi:hypothetical protein
MGKTDLITLPKTSFLYAFLVVFVVLPTILLFVFSNSLPALWCRYFELPEYENQLGFKTGEILVQEPGGDSFKTWGITWVDSAGPLGRAGVRAGDVPRMHPAVGGFCSGISLVAEGRPMEFQVMNMLEPPDRPRTWRKVVVRTQSP